MRVTSRQLASIGKRRPRPGRPEREIQAAVIAFLRLVGFPVQRQNSGAAMLRGRDGRPQPVRFGSLGAADLMIVLPPDGKAAFCELKAADGVVTPEQQAYLQRMREAGAVAFVARSLDDVRRELRPWLPGWARR